MGRSAAVRPHQLPSHDALARLNQLPLRARVCLSALRCSSRVLSELPCARLVARRVRSVARTPAAAGTMLSCEVGQPPLSNSARSRYARAQAIFDDPMFDAPAWGDDIASVEAGLRGPVSVWLLHARPARAMVTPRDAGPSSTARRTPSSATPARSSRPRRRP